MNKHLHTTRGNFVFNFHESAKTWISTLDLDGSLIDIEIDVDLIEDEVNWEYVVNFIETITPEKTTAIVERSNILLKCLFEIVHSYYDSSAIRFTFEGINYRGTIKSYSGFLEHKLDFYFSIYDLDKPMDPIDPYSVWEVFTTDYKIIGAKREY